jgi:diaminohydroxyphosphoribosylaminopyrimidine deaminase/5-amino-6-(5-phosphoribosylamino)uracil reductase
VVVKGGRVVGRGLHRRFGGPHAEVEALRQAGPRARGATLYVTLEPCKHFGKTPPCVPGILAAGVRAVVLGARDPNPPAAGGAAELRRAGVRVVEGILESECRELNAAFFKHVRTGLPLVTLKWAMTCDGKLATAKGESRWITGRESREFVHRLRAAHDAVLAGIGTVLKDAPRLTARPEGARGWRPKRVILDRRARTPLSAPLWSARGGGPIIICAGAGAPPRRIRALERKGAKVLLLPERSGRLPIPEVLRRLGATGITSLLVEGGSEISGAFLDARAADQVCAFIAPKLLGGRKSVPAVGGEGAPRMRDALRLREVRYFRFGPDMLLTGRLGRWSWLAPAT